MKAVKGPEEAGDVLGLELETRFWSVCGSFLHRTLTASERARQWLIQTGGRASNEVAVVHVGMDTHLFNPTERERARAALTHLLNSAATADL